MRGKDLGVLIRRQKGHVHILFLCREGISGFSKYAHIFPRILQVRLYVSAYFPNTQINLNLSAPRLDFVHGQTTFRS